MSYIFIPETIAEAIKVAQEVGEMPVAEPELLIDVTAVTPPAPSPWTVIIRVRLKLPDGTIQTAPAGSVAVTLDHWDIILNIYLRTYGTKDVNANGQVSFTAEGPLYTGVNWIAELCNVYAEHKATGATVSKKLVLDSQIPFGGVFAWPWDPFPYPEAAREWSDPDSESTGFPSGNEW